MKFRVAIQPDQYGPGDSAYPIYKQYIEKAGHEVRLVNVFRSDILDQLKGCHGFMWRFAYFSYLHPVAKRLLPVIENELGLPVYPDQNTCWHYDDKISQSYLLKATGIPTPDTWVWYDEDLAKEWATTATYPLVLKLWGGASSDNVVLIRDYAQAEKYITKLFGRGVRSAMDFTDPFHGDVWSLGRTRIRAALKLLLKGTPPREKIGKYSWEVHKNYVLFQEFLSGNEYDTRVAVVGKRAFAQRRFNRPDDFRASGSGIFDADPAKIDLRAIRLGFKVAERLKTQSVALDCLKKGDELVVGEISFSYVVGIGYELPGHWELLGDAESGELVWVEGRMYREEGQVADFLARLEAKYGQTGCGR